ncbi:MAG: alpha-glucosidase [Atopobiaceae bacterium]|nr:alpha-glucosidase [Atopobiaceae bacterium]
MTTLNDLAWWQKTIAYEVYPKSFLDTRGQGTGTLAGITAKLDYLRSLGVGAIWITPCYQSPMVDNGYDVQDYRQIDPSFGTMADMDELIAQGNERGIKVVMDLVFNHTSEQCAWFVESRKSREGAYADWYIWRDPAPDGGAPTNWRSIFGGSAWEWCEERQQYYLHTFAPQQPDLNWENPDVRRALIDIANFWADKGVGGFRIDAITYIKKPAVFADGPVDGEDGMSAVHAATANTPGILDFLHEFKTAVRDGRDIFMVGEANGVAADELDQWVGERGVFDMLFEFSHTHVPMGAAEVWCRPAQWQLTDLKHALTASQQATADRGWYPIFFENHDQPRSTVNFFRCDGSVAAKAKALGTVLLTLRGTPFVMQGQELGYGNRAWKSIDEFDDLQTRSQYDFALGEGFSPEEALAACNRFSRDNARTPLQWDASANAGFTAGTPWLPVHDDYATVNVEAESADPESPLSWYRRLAELRACRSELVCGSYEELMATDEQVYAYRRQGEGAAAVVLANLSGEAAAYDAALVEGMELLVGTHGPTELGILRPLEAVVFGA